MGYTELIVVLCFVITIWSNTANADVDCRKFVFAPSCRGVSAKRSWPLNKDNNHGIKEDVSEEQQQVSEDNGEERLFQIRPQRKRFEDLLRTSLSRRTRSKNMKGLRAVLSPYASIDEILGSNDDE